MVDWLTVSDDLPGPGEWPIFAATVSDHTELATGLLTRSYKGAELRGSYDSRLDVLCNGAALRLSGNPSRWERRDNVFGCPSMPAARAVFDGVVTPHEFPRWSDGARLSRVDVAVNLAVGAGNEPAAMRWLGQQTRRGKSARRYADGSTVEWPASRRVYVKYYVKAKELDRHHGRVDGEVREWRSAVAAFCRAVGLVRCEVTLRGQALAERGWHRFDAWTGETMAEVIRLYGVHGRVVPVDRRVDGLADRLVSLGHGERAACRLELHARAWAQGGALRELLPRSSYYRVRSALLAVGIDVGGVAEATPAPIAEQVGWSAVECPSWYQEAA